MVGDSGDGSRGRSPAACGFVDQSVLLRLAANSGGFSQAIGEIAENWLRFARQPLIVAYFIFPKKLSTP
jgi:hypothetical protein